jgi:hypothetical protein
LFTIREVADDALPAGQDFVIVGQPDRVTVAFIRASAPAQETMEAISTALRAYEIRSSALALAEH